MRPDFLHPRGRRWRISQLTNNPEFPASGYYISVIASLPAFGWL
jgi:hypothetical protein